MNIGKWTYFVWLVGCSAPILLGQWAFFSAILRRQTSAIFLSAFGVGTFLTVVDNLAIRDGVWEFSPELTLGIRFGSVPLEEAMFFVLTALLVSQAMTLFTFVRDRSADGDPERAKGGAAVDHRQGDTRADMAGMKRTARGTSASPSGEPRAEV